jgi:hypothetical protein
MIQEVPQIIQAIEDNMVQELTDMGRDMVDTVMAGTWDTFRIMATILGMK